MRPCVLLGVGLLVAGCGGPRPTVETKGGAFEFMVPKKFVSRLEPKVVAESGKSPRLVLDCSGFPADGTTVSWAGKEIPIGRNATIDENVDVSDLIGAAPISTFDIQPSQPLRVSFAKGKHVFDLTLPRISSSSALHECMKSVASAPCRFTGDTGVAKSSPVIAYFAPGSYLSPRMFGTPAKNSDIDWIAIGKTLDPQPGQKCSMKRMGDKLFDDTGVESTFELKIMREEVNVYDRRTGAKVQTATLLGSERCPVVATIKVDPKDGGLKSEITDLTRETLFRSMRGETTAAPAPTTSATPPTTPKKKKKH